MLRRTTGQTCEQTGNTHVHASHYTAKTKADFLDDVFNRWNQMLKANQDEGL